MKIAQIVCVFPPYRGGMGQSVYDISKFLGEKGLAVDVYTPSYKALPDRAGADGKFNIIRMKPLLKYGNGAFLRGLAGRLRDYNIVDLHYPFFGTAETVWLAKFLNKKKFRLVTHYHMDAKDLSLAAKILSLPSSLILKSLLNISEAVVCSSFDYARESSAGKILEGLGDKVYEIPFGVDTSLFCPAARRPDKKTVDIIFIGGLDKAHYFKGLDVLLRAVAILKKDGWRLSVIGRGELKEQYAALAGNLGIGERVNFLGGVSDKEKIVRLKDADLLVLPSINSHEAFGIVLVEAMASGVPVIASDLPGVRLVFKNGTHGYLARPGDAADLSAKIRIMISNGGQRKKMGEEAARYARLKYDGRKNVEKLLEVYGKILEN